MALIRLILGQIILFLNWLTFPAKGQRASEKQLQVEESLRSFSIYEFKACPFCVRLRRELQRLNLPIELRDAKSNPEHRKALESGGGKVQVPCLRIEKADGSEQWMYESKEIIHFLQKEFPLA